MKVLLSWLAEFADVGNDAVAIGDELSDLGLAVESMTRLGEGLDDIVVARVLDLRAHPDADRIQLVDVDPGDGNPIQVCCGAFNMSVGDLVPLAPVGAGLPGGMRIERRKMRGQISEGMLCSATELGLGSDAAGIMVLGGDLTVGAGLAEALDLSADVLYDLEVNPNRPDAMSVAGVARDLAARLGVPFRIAEPQVPTTGTEAAQRVSVEIESPDLCGRFLARVLDGVSVGPSPAWMARRLLAAGMRPINNIVDISNYVMLELGQPNHTYDLDLVRGGALRIRWAADGEAITTLDDVERVLSPGDGVIADGDDTPIGIAGVMGGASTEIGPGTNSVLLEMAWWDPMTIARSSRRLGLRSEASMRFERGADPEMAPLAALRFAELAAATGATLAPGQSDQRGELPRPEPVRVRTDRVNRLLGTELDSAAIAGALEPIGFACERADDDVDVTIPSWRYDSATETDVIEEVARHVGYSRITPRRPSSVTTGALNDRQILRRRLRSVLVGAGLCEAMPTPMRDPAELSRVRVRTDAVVITNPLAAEESVLRTSLRPGLLAAVAHNTAHRNSGVRLFEIGKVFLPAEPGPLPDEPEHLAVVLAGAEAPEAVRLLDSLAPHIGAGEVDLRTAAVEGLHPTRAAEVLFDGTVVGVVGEIDPEITAAADISERVAWLELDLDAAVEAAAGRPPYRSVSRYPSSDVDLAFEVADDVSARAVAATLRSADPLVVAAELFDAYRGEPVPEGSRSLAYRVRLQAADRTLTDEEVAAAREALIAAARNAHSATLRGES